MPRDLHFYLQEYRRNNKIYGNRPVFITIKKSKEKKHKFKGNYLLTYTDNELYFHELNYFLHSKGKNDFIIQYELLDSFRLKFYKTSYRMMTLYFKSGNEIELYYLYECQEAFDNEANINFIIKFLKDKGIKQLSNQKKGDSNEQRKISKLDQAFTQEIRSPKKYKHKKAYKGRLFERD